MSRRGDADFVVIAFAVLAAIVFMWVSAAAPAKSVSVHAYAPLPSQAFLPIPPLVRPIRPASGSAGRNGSPPAGELTEPPSTPSSRPPRRILPTHSITGVATFYAAPTGTAAAARALRSAIGNTWRGTRVRVSYGGRSIVVVLDDWESSTIPGRLIDLSEGSFAALVGPGWYQRGVAVVEVSW